MKLIESPIGRNHKFSFLPYLFHMILIFLNEVSSHHRKMNFFFFQIQNFISTIWHLPQENFSEWKISGFFIVIEVFFGWSLRWFFRFQTLKSFTLQSFLKCLWFKGHFHLTLWFVFVTPQFCDLKWLNLHLHWLKLRDTLIFCKIIREEIFA